MGRLRPDIAGGVRSFRAGRNYLVLYRITENQVQIVRYVYARRDLTNVI